MSPIMDRLSRSTVARIAGVFYLLFILASVLADVLSHIGLGTADKIYATLVTSPFSYRLGVLVGFKSAFLFIMAAWALYVLLRPVDENLALLFLVLNAVGVAIQCASMIPLIAALLINYPATPAGAMAPDQAKALAYLMLDVYKTSFVTAQLFFGTWLFPLGYLVYKSRFLPRFLGVLLIADGFAVLIWFAQGLLAPNLKFITYPGLAISFLAEFGLALWLLIRGAEKADAPAE